MNINFIEAVQYLYPGVSFLKDVIVHDDGLGPYLYQWNLPGEPPTDQQIADAIAAIPGAVLTAKRNAAKAIIDNDVPDGRVERAVIALLVQELNLLREWIESFKSAVAASVSLANLQTRVAALATMSDRTGPQVTNAIKSAIDLEM